MVLHQGKPDNQSWRKDIKTCYYHGKPGHIVHFCYKAKNNRQDNTNNTKEDDDYAFATQYGTHSKAMCKWIMNLGVVKHMTFHMA